MYFFSEIIERKNKERKSEIVNVTQPKRTVSFLCYLFFDFLNKILEKKSKYTSEIDSR